MTESHENISVRLANALRQNGLSLDDCKDLGAEHLKGLPGFGALTVAEAMNALDLPKDGGGLRTRFRMVRERAGMDEQSFANALRISLDRCKKYERGVARIPVDVLQTLVVEFRVSTDWFLFGEGGKPEPNAWGQHEDKPT